MFACVLAIFIIILTDYLVSIFLYLFLKHSVEHIYSFSLFQDTTFFHKIAKLNMQCCMLAGVLECCCLFSYWLNIYIGMHGIFCSWHDFLTCFRVYKLLVFSAAKFRISLAVSNKITFRFSAERSLSLVIISSNSYIVVVFKITYRLKKEKRQKDL